MISKLLCTDDNIIFQWPPEPEELTHNGILLTKHLEKDVDWAHVVAAGPTSVLKPGDEILVSRRVTSFKFEHEGQKYYNTSDKSVIGYYTKEDWLAATLRCTGTHVLGIWLDDEPQTIIHKTQLEDTGWAKVIAAGPKSGVKKDDLILIGRHFAGYEFPHAGMTLRTIPGESIIAFKEAA